MDFSGMPLPSGREELSSGEHLVTIQKLRRSIQTGALEKRAKLVDGLSRLSTAYAQESKYVESLAALDEAIELGDILAEEGQLEARNELALDVFSLMAALRGSEGEDGKRFDRNAFYSRFKQCVNNYSENRPTEVQLIWAKEVYEQAKDLYDEDYAKNPIISMLDALIQELEPHFNWQSRRFVEWDGLMSPYLLRGTCKYDMGDRNSAIEDLKRFEELSETGVDILNHGKMKSTSGPIKDGKIVVRVNMEDFIDLMGCVGFRMKRFECMNRLAHIYAEKADKDKSIEYYDKALDAARQKLSSPFPMAEGFSLYSAPAEIPYRKGHLYLLFHEPENALTLFNEALRATEELLETDNKDYLDELESRFSEYCRARSNALRALKRYDEAVEAIDRANEYFARVRKEAAKRVRDMPLDDMLKVDKKEAGDDDEPVEDVPLPNKYGQSSSATGKDSRKQSRGAQKKSLKDMGERDMWLLLGTKHNEAMMDAQRGNVDMDRGRYRSALAKFLKARIVLDCFLLEQMSGTGQNKFMVYFYIATSYGVLEHYDKAEMWFERTEKIVLKLIDDGKLELRKEYCRLLAARGKVFSLQGKWNEAIQLFEQSIKSGNALIEEAMENVEGQNLERLLAEDNQRIMQIVDLHEMLTKVYEDFIIPLLHHGRLDEAVTRSREYVQCTEEMIRLLPDNGMPLSRQVSALRMLIATLRLAGQDEQADAAEGILFDLYRQRDPHLVWEKSKGILDRTIESKIFLTLFADPKLRDLQDDYWDAMNFAKEGRKDDALETIADIREEVVAHVRFGKEDPQMVVQLREHLLAMLDRTAGRIRDDKLDVTKRIARLARQDADNVDGEHDIIDILDAFFPSKSVLDESDMEDYTVYEREIPGFDTKFELLLQIGDELSETDRYAKYVENIRAGRISPELKAMENYALSTGKQETIRNTEARIGRNDPCPCGSGKKYKKCCGK